MIPPFENVLYHKYYDSKLIRHHQMIINPELSTQYIQHQLIFQVMNDQVMGDDSDKEKYTTVNKHYDENELITDVWRMLEEEEEMIKDFKSSVVPYCA